MPSKSHVSLIEEESQEDTFISGKATALFQGQKKILSVVHKDAQVIAIFVAAVRPVRRGENQKKNTHLRWKHTAPLKRY